MVKAVTNYYDKIIMPSGITLNQYFLLVNIMKIAPCSISALAKKVNLERSTLVRNIKPLISGGLVEDLSNTGERDRQLNVTRPGRKCLETAQPLWERAQTGLRSCLGEEDFEKLMEAAAHLEKLD
jgi:DNA-binding MarR family transcriptional regulator